VLALAERCPKLRSLELYDCPNITNAAKNTIMKIESRNWKAHVAACGGDQ